MDILKGPPQIIAQKEFSALSMYLRADGIMITIFKDNMLINIQNAMEAMQWVESLGPAKYYNLFCGGKNSDFDPEVRAFAAQTGGNHYTYCDAMVAKSDAHKLIANFYLQFNKPEKPTKVFQDENEAIAWLLEQKAAIAL